MEELSDSTYEIITQLVDEAENDCRRNDFRSSISKYKKAARLLPKPRYEWEAYSWLMCGIGLNYVEIENWQEAFKFLNYSLLSSDEMVDASVWFHTGQALYKMGRFDESKDYLIKAFILNKGVFDKHDPEYKAFIVEDLRLMNEAAGISDEEGGGS